MKRRSHSPRDIAGEISAKFIAKLEQGVRPWSRPWRSAGARRPLRFNGQRYSGINVIMLWMTADEAGYRSPFWMTYRQAEEIGGQVRRGEHGTTSVYYSSFEKNEDGPAGDEVTKTVRFLKSYSVFNADQIDGLPPHFYVHDEAPLATPSERQDAIDAFVRDLPAKIRHGGNSAYFSPSADYIQMPRPEQFVSADHYAGTLAHEATHWTGHESRLARAFGKRFGDDAYAFEELVAEIGSALVCAELQLPHELDDHHAAYLAHWIKILKGDKSAIIHAAAKAEQAFGYLMHILEQARKETHHALAA